MEKKIINNKTYTIIQVSVTYLLLSKVHYSKIITKLQKHSSFNDLYHMTIYDNLEFLFLEIGHQTSEKNITLALTYLTDTVLEAKTCEINARAHNFK